MYYVRPYGDSRSCFKGIFVWKSDREQFQSSEILRNKPMELVPFGATHDKRKLVNTILIITTLDTTRTRCSITAGSRSGRARDRNREGHRKLDHKKQRQVHHANRGLPKQVSPPGGRWYGTMYTPC